MATPETSNSFLIRTLSAKDIRPGVRIICNGYPMTVQAIKGRMVECRGRRGLVTTSMTELIRCQHQIDPSAFPAATSKGATRQVQITQVFRVARTVIIPVPAEGAAVADDNLEKPAFDDPRWTADWRLESETITTL